MTVPLLTRPWPRRTCEPRSEPENARIGRLLRALEHYFADGIAGWARRGFGSRTFFALLPLFGDVRSSTPEGIDSCAACVLYWRVSRIHSRGESMRRVLFAWIVAIAAGVPAAAHADEQVLVILNSTKADLLELYARPVQAQDWGVDQLGTMRIAAGGKVTVRFGTSQSPPPSCDYDLRMVFADGESVIRRANICDIRMLTVTEKTEEPLQSA